MKLFKLLIKLYETKTIVDKKITSRSLERAGISKQSTRFKSTHQVDEGREMSLRHNLKKLYGFVIELKVAHVNYCGKNAPGSVLSSNV